MGGGDGYKGVGATVLFSLMKKEPKKSRLQLFQGTVATVNTPR